MSLTDGKGCAATLPDRPFFDGSPLNQRSPLGPIPTPWRLASEVWERTKATARFYSDGPFGSADRLLAIITDRRVDPGTLMPAALLAACIALLPPLAPQQAKAEEIIARDVVYTGRTWKVDERVAAAAGAWGWK